MKKLIVLLVVALCMSMTMQAQSYESTADSKWKVEFSAGLNNYSAWELEPAVTYRPIPWVGVRFGLLMSDVIDKNYPSGESADGKFWWVSDKDRVGYHNILMRPALVLSTPEIHLGHSGDYGVSLQFSPGLSFPVKKNNQIEINYYPNVPGMWGISKYERIKNQGGKYTLYKHLSAALAFRIKEFEIAAGYTWSDLDPFGASRNIRVENKPIQFERNKNTHSVFLRLGYFFN